jgi:hypothetical protein
MINMVNQLLYLLKYADIDTMNSKATMTFSTLAIAAVALLFASGPILAAHQASAIVYVHRHYGYHHGHYYRPYHGYYHGHYYRHYHGHGVYHKGVTVKTPRGIYHKGVTVRRY